MLVGCLLWLPWCVSQGQEYFRLGNAWLWAGPYKWKELPSCESNLMGQWDETANDWICIGHASLDDIVELPQTATVAPSAADSINLSAGFVPKKAKRIAYKDYDEYAYAQPDTRLILLRLLAATTIRAAAFVPVGLG